MPATPQPGSYVLNPAGSSVTVEQKTMWGLVKVVGTFASVSGKGEVLADGTASGTVVLDAASLSTKHTKRDTHLRSDDFFAVDTYPTLTFEAVAARRDGDDVSVDGRLTVRDTTRLVPVSARATHVDGQGATLDTEFTVDRSEFGLTWNQMGMVRGPVTVRATLRFTRDDAV